MEPRKDLMRWEKSKMRAAAFLCQKQEKEQYKGPLNRLYPSRSLDSLFDKEKKKESKKKYKDMIQGCTLITLQSHQMQGRKHPVYEKTEADRLLVLYSLQFYNQFKK